MTLLLYKDPVFLFGIPIFAYVGVVAVILFFWMCISLAKETMQDLKRRMESDTQEVSLWKTTAREIKRLKKVMESEYNIKEVQIN